MADPARLRQILRNLLSNAVKFTASGGSITVSTCGAKDGKAEISISDNGEGIAPEYLADAFEPFTQADYSTTRTHGGLGLGLAIASELVKLQGGTISVASGGHGQGAPFTVVLPLARKAGRHAAAQDKNRTATTAPG
jgi:diguanylate cyclase